MKNDLVLRNRYLDQYKDIYGDNIYLSSIESVNNKINTIKGGSKFTAFYNLIKDCKDCAYNNSDVDFGVGNENSKIVFITEAICKGDYYHYNSLTGDVGQLFDKILSAINLSRKDIYILYLFKYIPSKNSDSYQTEIRICEYHLQQQLKIINPNLIVALGEDVGKKILNVNQSVENSNGNIHKLEDFDLMITHHPVAILENSKLKESTWKDYKNIRDNYLN